MDEPVDSLFKLNSNITTRESCIRILLRLIPTNQTKFCKNSLTTYCQFSAFTKYALMSLMSLTASFALFPYFHNPSLA